MKKKREARALHLRHSFWRGTMYWYEGKKGSARVFLHFKTSHFFFGRLLDQHNAQEKKEGKLVFLPFLAERTQKKLNMIAREFEFVVGRMY